MHKSNLITYQLKQVQEWTWKLIDGLTDESWMQIPDTIESNIHWQIGHLVITHFYHILVCQKEPTPELMNIIPIMDYFPIFSSGTHAAKESHVSIDELKRNLRVIQEKEIEIISALNEEDLSNMLFPTQFKHPIANNKLDAICWDIQHTMWHCGQIAMIKRIVDKPYDFVNM